MLHDVDQTIEKFIRRRCQIGNDIEVSFDAPTRDWSARRNSPTIDLFLYDLRENLDRRHAALDGVRDATGMVTSIPLATRWFNCSYLVTAWTQRAEDEHRLLSSLLLGFLETHALPREDLVGALTTSERTIMLTIGRPPTQDRSISDIWSALGGELKPSLDLVVIVPFEPVGTQFFGPPVLEAPSLSFDGDPNSLTNGKRIPGHRRAGTPAERDLTYSLHDDPESKRSEEEAVAGTPEQPGRRFRFSVHEPVRKGRPRAKEERIDSSRRGEELKDADKNGSGKKKP
jgi:hypothetical protein